MLINLDAKALEWFGAVYLSKDKIGYQEIIDGVDQHSENQKTLGLGEGDDGRFLAKIFVFRLIYGGTAPAYAQDADFTKVSTDSDFWQRVIDKFYNKYEGIAQWHENLVFQAMSTGRIQIPTGREFRFVPNPDSSWPRTKILNYPVQGFGADLMVIARVLLWEELKTANIKFVCTVHDSIVLDVPNDIVFPTIKRIYMAWNRIPAEFERRFKVPLDLPLRVEVSYGPNWKAQTKVTENEC